MEKIEVKQFRNTFKLTVDADITNEIIRITTSEVVGGYFEITLPNANRICVEQA